MEHVREYHIEQDLGGYVATVDTNKATYERTFDSYESAREWMMEMLAEFNVDFEDEEK